MATGSLTEQELKENLRKVWGYDSFRPLQAEAMTAVLQGRDSVVVLPTGGGKSLCFQAPALCLTSLAVVVSPLISLMKDQVDALRDCGVAAACVNSTMPPQERRQVADEVRAGRLKLLYLSPERLVTPTTIRFLQEVQPAFFAIDEAHCISDWGHDFRPEYRALKQLKQQFPDAALHAYTATATRQVRDDIARQLALDEPEVLVGSFDRPNLVYRVQRRADRMRQICDVIDRHPGDSGIIYCMRRADTEEIAASLTESGRPAAAYHAGLSDEQRHDRQEAFITDRTRIIVATVAFGMGIDKSDVRYVIHATAPKSLESYQQESGRAGRDGLEAECWLFYSGGDFATWRKLQEELPPPAHQAAMSLLDGIEGFSKTTQCRHQAILSYFGQQAESPNCNACDVCLDEVELADDADVLGQKIVSCVVRLEQSFGAHHTAKVLTGSREQRILDLRHDSLSTHGILAEHNARTVGEWIDQLVDQNYLRRYGEYNVLQVTAAGGELLRGQHTPRLTKPAPPRRKESKVSKESWEGVDRDLFESLRALRRELADAKGLPPFVVFGDATLRDLARRRPASRELLLDVHGIGDKKASQYGEAFMACIAEFCQANGIAQDQPAEPKPASKPVAAKTVNATKRQALEMLAAGSSIEQVCAATDRAESTVTAYLIELIEQQGISDATAWIDDATFEAVRAASLAVGAERLKPIYDELDEQVSYDQIRITMACLANLN